MSSIEFAKQKTSSKGNASRDTKDKTRSCAHHSRVMMLRFTTNFAVFGSSFSHHATDHRFAHTAAPPSRAAAPTAAVFIGAAAMGGPLTLIVGPPYSVALMVVITAEVKGTPPVVLVAPSYAGACEAAVGLGTAVVLLGFKTLLRVSCQRVVYRGTKETERENWTDPSRT
jgi:hypothetical protein